MENWEKPIYDLKEIVSRRRDLHLALGLSVQKASVAGVRTLEDYYVFLRKLLTELPRQRDMSELANQFHFLISQSPGNILKKDEEFLRWLRKFSVTHGDFLDTIASAGNLELFYQDPSYQIDDYQPGASGWLTFNQFFARHVKSGRRPIDELCNPEVVVSPTDSVFKGCWQVDENSSVHAKGTNYKIKDLLKDSPYAEKFHGGVFTHSYLNSNDYHRFHVPVAGIIKELRLIPGNVIVDAIKKQDGQLETLDEVGFQFSQTRGLLIIESAVGLVAVLPIGMGHVSSVNFTTDLGAELFKGQEFGYFSYGGSDMVMVFQADKIAFTAEPGRHYKQGKMLATRI